MESRSNFDFKSDLDFPSLSSNVASSKRNPSPVKEKPSKQVLQNGNKEPRDNSRSMSRGRGKKQNWKAVHVEFNNNNGGQRYPQRGTSRPRFGNNHAISKPAEDDQPYEYSYRGYRNGSRSRIRRARGGTAPHHFGRPQSAESTTPLLSNSPTSDLSPTIMAIPYHPNFAAYVQPHVTNTPLESAPVGIEEAIRHQIEYYFSEENLIKDNYMRLNMSSEGFLSIELISNFNKIKQFNVDIETITRAIEVSDKLDVVDRKIVRPVIDPLRWPLSMPLPPPVSNMMKNFVQPDSLVGPLQTNGTIYQEIVPELDTSDMIYQTIPPGALELVAASPVEDMVYQEIDPVDHLSTYIGSITFADKSVFNYPQYSTEYPTEMQDQQTLEQDAAYSYDTCSIDSPDDESCQQKPQTEVNQEDTPQQNEAPTIANGHNDCPSSVPKETSQDFVDTSSKTVKEKVSYSSKLRYPTDTKDVSHCQPDVSFQQDSIDVIRCQQDTQDVGRYQHMFTYVSS